MKEFGLHNDENIDYTCNFCFSFLYILFLQKEFVIATLNKD